MGARHSAPALTAVDAGEFTGAGLKPSEAKTATNKRTEGECDVHPPSTPARPACGGACGGAAGPSPSPIPYLAIDAKGHVFASSTVSASTLATLTAIPERDARMLLPPDPAVHSPSGSPLAGPAVLARRGEAWVVGLEGVRGVVLSDRVILLAGPASSLGALDSAGRAPQVEDDFVAGLASRVAAAGSSLQPTALEAMCEAVVAALEARSSALESEAVSAGDALLAAAAGRGGSGSAGLSACFCCASAPPPPPHPPAARLRRVKGEVSDLEAAARRVSAALAPSRALRRRQGAQSGEVVEAILTAATARAAAAGGLTSRAAASARDAETAARMALRRRALACGGA